MIKKYNYAAEWIIYDSTRDPTTRVAQVNFIQTGPALKMVTLTGDSASYNGIDFFQWVQIEVWKGW